VQTQVKSPLIRHAGQLLTENNRFPLLLICGFCNSGQALRAE